MDAQLLREYQVSHITILHNEVIMHGYLTTTDGNIAVSGKARGFYEAYSDYKANREKAGEPWYSQIPDDMVTPRQVVQDVNLIRTIV